MDSIAKQETQCVDDPNTINRPAVLLTTNMIETIKQSVVTFAPSKSLADLVSAGNTPPSPLNRKNQSIMSYKSLDKMLDIYQDYDTMLHKKPSLKPSSSYRAEIDLVISGGGLKGYFMCGVNPVLTSALKAYNINIARIAGASAGAWAGFFMIIGISTSFWMETYFACKERDDDVIHVVYEEVLIPRIKAVIKEDCYKKLNGRLFISITTLNQLGIPRNEIISEFTSNDDLFSALLASSNIPLLSEPNYVRYFRGALVFDGGITNNIPIFEDRIHRQLVFNLFEVEYPNHLLITPKDPCIESLVLKGALLISKFLQGDQCNHLKSIYWLEKHEIACAKKRRKIITNLTTISLISAAFLGLYLMKDKVTEVFGRTSCLLLKEK